MSYAPPRPTQKNVQNINAYIARERAVRYTPSRITPDGRAVRVMDGREIPEQEFLSAFPMVKLQFDGFNKGDIIGNGIEK